MVGIAAVPAFAEDTTKVLLPTYENGLTVTEKDGATVTWRAGGSNGVAELMTGPSSGSQAVVYLQLLPSELRFGDMTRIAYTITQTVRSAANLNFELMVPNDTGTGFQYPNVQYIPAKDTSGEIVASDGTWTFRPVGGGALEELTFAQAQERFAASRVSKIYLSIGSGQTESSSSVDDVVLTTADGTRTYDFQIPVIETTTTVVRPGAEIGGWKIITSGLSGSAPAGWVDTTDTGPPPAGPDGSPSEGSAYLTAADDKVTSIESNAYAGTVLSEIQEMSATVQQADDGTIGARFFLRTTANGGDCRLSFGLPDETGWVTHDLLTEPYWGDTGTCGGIAGATWDDLLANLDIADATIRPNGIIPGVGFATGSSNSSDYRSLYVDAFSIDGQRSDFEPPTIGASGTATSIEVGTSVDVPLTVTLSGPNGPVAENALVNTTTNNGQTSSATPTVTATPAGLCTVAAGPVTFAPVANKSISKPLQQQVVVRVSTSGTEPGTCDLALADPANAVVRGDQIRITVKASTTPQAPTGVTAESGPAGATVSWTPPTEDGGSPVTGYTVWAYAFGSTSPIRSAFVPGDTTSKVVSPLPVGTAVYFRVQASNDVGPGPESAASDPVVPTWPAFDRLSGSDRYSTAVAVSKAAFPAGADVAYVVNGTTFPDALAAGPAAGAQDGPLLLTSGTEVPQVVADELARLDPARIVVVGGTGVVSDAVLEALEAIAPTERIFGASRYATAAEVAAYAYPAGTDAVYLATGESFADALGAGPAAVAEGAPILLTPTATLHPDTAAAIAALGASRVVIVGGTGAVSTAVEESVAGLVDDVVRIAGKDRYETAALVTKRVFVRENSIYLATGTDFPDALGGGAAAGAAGVPLLLTQPGCLPTSTANEIVRLVPAKVQVLGGAPVVSDAAAGGTVCTTP